MRRGEAVPLISTVVNIPTTPGAMHAVSSLGALQNRITASLSYAYQSLPTIHFNRKKTLKVVEVGGELSALPGSLLTGLSLQTLGGQNGGLGFSETTVMGPFWNVWGWLRWAFSVVDDFLNAKKSAVSKNPKLIIAIINVIHYGFILPSLTGYAYFKAIKSAEHIGFLKVLWESSVTLGSSSAWAASDAAFGVDLLLCAVKDIRSYIRAYQKSDPIALLEDRYKKLLAVENNLNISEDKKEKIKNQFEVLCLACYSHPVLNKKINDEIKRKYPKDLFVNSSEIIIEAKNIASYLLNKQLHKLNALRWAILGNLLGVVGAGFGSASMLVDQLELSKAMLWPSAVFYNLSTSVKYSELFKLHCCSETSNQENENPILEWASENPHQFFSERDIQLIKRYPSLSKNSIAFFQISSTPEDAVVVNIPNALM